ncbi:MAG: glutamate synthase-related protein, partial [Pseudomonadota bacterium]
GAPWELGLAEAHQVLTLNNLRSQVTLRTDGGIRTGRDVVIAAMLGAEEYGIGTISLVAMGCLMVRQCHSNTCPVGVCTQDEDLRGRFPGIADHVVNLMTFIAEETRAILAGLGARSLEDVIGRADLLDQVSRGAPHLDDLDLNPILTMVDAGERPMRSLRTGRTPVNDTVDQAILPELAAFLERRERVQIRVPVRNTDRAVGTRISAHIVRRFDPETLSEDHVAINLNGSAGQSLGAFGARGLKLTVDGDANDYVGKGLSGAMVVVRPADKNMGTEDSIIGNTCLYGATSGALFAAGRAGGRFAVRNSGADAVIEGCSANGCEYMTGGTVVILGPVGSNFAAGMTGGIAYVLDEHGRFTLNLNGESVAVREFDPDKDHQCEALIRRHLAETGSPRAAALLDDWPSTQTYIRVVEPLEMIAYRQRQRDNEQALDTVTQSAANIA